MSKLGDRMKKSIKAWLDINDIGDLKVTVSGDLSFEANALKNKVWYQGDPNELSALYEQLKTHRDIDNFKFWGARSTSGLEIQKRHTGLPGMIVDTLVNIVTYDYNGLKFDNPKDIDTSTWEELEDENNLNALIKTALAQTMYIGDGAFKFSFDSDISDLPIIEWWPGDCIDLKHKRGRLREIIFSSTYSSDSKTYTLKEIYGFGYIKYKLYQGDKEVPLDTIPDTANLEQITFGGAEVDEATGKIKNGDYMWAVYMQFGASEKYKGRGRSIYDRKEDSFDSFDESFSQWMDALRSGRTKTYIPDMLIPRNPNNGSLIKPNPFDSRFIAVGNDASENGQNKITTESPAIQHESYLSSYITALDLCLQGIISPSTLGIDVKKLDNAESQREKEKTTLYTRQILVGILSDAIPAIAETAFKILADMNATDGTSELGSVSTEISCTCDFGEYANPSFESQVETIGKARTQGVMSTEASVEELYGDSKDEDWKTEEVKRIKAEQGIVEVEEPGNYEDLINS